MFLKKYHWFVRRRKNLFFSLLVWSILFSCGLLFLPSNEELIIDLSNNYFQPPSTFTTGKFFIEDDKCRIPDINVWDEQVRNLYQAPPLPKCHESPKITLIRNNNVVINEITLRKLGYKMEDISCCYYTIQRVAQNRTNFNKDADNKFRFSSECYPMKKVTTPISGFIKISCKISSSMIQLISNFYEQFHAVAMFPEDASGINPSENLLSNKISFWKKRIDNGLTTLPPNILILGIDSTSSLNFRRLMQSTLKVLKTVIKAEELKGYTKVAVNTLPNFLPLLTSFTKEQLYMHCHPNDSVPFDDCPFIWNEFSRNNYLTAHMEDAPGMAIFNFRKVGFLNSPVDFYIRPLMQAAYKYQEIIGQLPWTDWTVNCLGYQRPEELIWNYIIDLAELAKTKQIPYIITSWLSDPSHAGMSLVQTLDKKLSETLLTLHMKNLLENTLLFVLSDHGFRYLKIRLTRTGWYEDKMPAMYIKLPSTIKRLHPDWANALKENSRKLVTPFDVHYTLRDILETFRVTEANEKSKPRFVKRVQKGTNGGKSLFRKIPGRTCEEACIPREYCPCAAPVAFDDEVFIKRAAQFFISYVNAQLPGMCAPLHASRVIAFGTPEKNYKTTIGHRSSQGYPEVSVISLTAMPGDFLYEVWLKYNRTKGNFTTVFDVLRMNSIGNRGSCVLKNEEFSHLEMYCYCKPFDYILSFVRKIT